MQIEIINLDPDSDRYKLIMHSCTYFCKILLPKISNDSNYKVDIIFLDKLEKLTYAETRWKDSAHKPKHCTVEIKKFKNTLTLIKTLAHEFTHVKQIFHNELVDIVSSDTDYLWKRKRYNIVTSDYWLLPWEIEANGFEVALIEKYRNQYDITLNELQTNSPKIYQKIDKKIVDTIPKAE